MMRFLLAFLLLLAGPCWAQNGLLKGDGQVEVSADGSLEFYQDKQLYVAQGNAVAKKGDFSVAADSMQAQQRKNKAGADEIYRVTASGHVLVTSGKHQVFGDQAVYEIDRQVAVLRGSHLRFTDGSTVVTARDSMEYWDAKMQAVARGAVVALRDKRRVEADAMVAQFRTLPNGGQEISQIVAEGNVKVITPQDVARGTKAVYDMNRNVAVLTGNVRITRGSNQLEGSVAEVDFGTGLSRIMSTNGQGRVRALLSPNQKN